MPEEDELLVSVADAAWLPEGGRADVVLAGPDAVPPDPTCLVRVLASRDGKVFTVPRADGKGLDLPTLPVGDGTAHGCLQALMAQVVGSAHPAVLLGYVRNVVPDAPADYPWPSPEAHFAVWHCAVPAACEPRGTWLDAAEAESQLGERHWWPLAAHVLETRSINVE